MPAANVPLVLLPRFTGLAGATAFATVALDVNDYVNAVVNLWRGKAIGMFQATFQESTDQIEWTTCGGTTAGFDPGEDTEAQVVAHLQKRWFRIVVSLAGTNPGVSCWAVGGLERR
ncbi:MAG TPA: hypothetical protein VI997_11090 [Candidatus Thermoplasmatota archaeon]|nr:hypothetical protein [Candidatus Thermoplasmatota archaeon]